MLNFEIAKETPSSSESTPAASTSKVVDEFGESQIKHLEENTLNCDYASESKDQHLLIGNDLLAHIFLQSEELIRLLLKIE